MNNLIYSNIVFLLSFSFIISKVRIYLIKQTYFLRELEDSLLIESASFSNQCITNFDEFKLTVKYPSSYNITNKEQFNFALKGTENTILNQDSLILTNIDSTQTVTFKTSTEEDSSSNRRLEKGSTEKGNYTLKSISYQDNNKTFNISKISPLSFCYTDCCLITNTSETLLIKKEDDDKMQVILNLDGPCTDINSSSKLDIRAVNPTKTIPLTDFCEKKNDDKSNNKNRIYINCTFQKDTCPLDGGEDDDKPNTYKIQFRGKSCEKDEGQYIDTKIQFNVVSGNYLLLNKVITCVLLFLLI